MQTEQKLEELFGEAYEIGHAHARANKKYIDIGWHKPLKEALELLGLDTSFLNKTNRSEDVD